jgi:hypothetical protein
VMCESVDCYRTPNLQTRGILFSQALVARQKWSLSCRDARAESRERLGIRAKLSDQQNGQDGLDQHGKQQGIQEQSDRLSSIQQAGTTRKKHSGHGDRPSTASVADSSQFRRHGHW